MADHCCICDTRRPIGGTKILVLNDGELWIEFCENCKDEPITNALTGEVVAVGTLFDGEVITPRSTPRNRWTEPEPDLDEMYLEYIREQEAEEEQRRLDAPTWYEVLGELLIQAYRPRARRVRA